MSVTELLGALHREAGSRAYIVRLDVLEQGATMLKARLGLSTLAMLGRRQQFWT